jgi:hypothetical protein
MKVFSSPVKSVEFHFSGTEEREKGESDNEISKKTK